MTQNLLVVSLPLSWLACAPHQNHHAMQAKKNLQIQNIRIRVDMESFVSGKKKLRIQKYLDTCGKGLINPRVLKSNSPACSFHMKMLDSAPFTVRTWKNEKYQ